MLSILLAAAAATTHFPQPPLQPWSALTGHCWTGNAPGDGIDKHCFEAVYGGQHIRDRHIVTVGGKEVYAGETIYSAKGPQVIFTYWNSLGGLGTGEAEVVGNEWRFSGTIRPTATSPEQPMPTVWKMVADGYEVRDGSEPARLFKRVD